MLQHIYTERFINDILFLIHVFLQVYIHRFLFLLWIHSCIKFYCTFCCNEQKCENFDGLHHQKTLEEYIHQIDAHKIFTMEEQTLDLVANIQWHRKSSILTLPFSWNGLELVFLQIPENYKNDWSTFVSAFLKWKKSVLKKLLLTQKLKINEKLN